MTQIDTHPTRSTGRQALPGVAAVMLSALLLASCDREAAPAATTPASPAAPENAAAPPTPAPADTPAQPDPTTTAAASTAAPAPTFEFVFSSRSTDDTRDPRILGWEDSPCGMGPRARIDRMPIDDPMLLPDWVIEFDDAGRERKRWGTPYEAEVLGLEGDMLRFRVHGHAHAYWTDPQGRIGTVAGDAQALPELQAPIIDCPTLPAFGASAYVYCSAVADDAQRTRKLAWEGPCT